MNTSNRFGIESIARERQAEIEQELRAQAVIEQELHAQGERRTGYVKRAVLSRRARWVALAIGAVGLSATVATVLLGNAP